MPTLTKSCWNGNQHVAIDYGRPRRLTERLGTVLARVQISDADVALGLDALALRHFPEPAPAEGYYGA
jgi:hypothetical protein